MRWLFLIPFEKVIFTSVTRKANKLERSAMASFDRTSDLTNLYDLVMLRKPVMLQAPDGMGKSFLLDQLISKLEGRRVCFYISLRGYNSFSQFITDWVEQLMKVSVQHSNLQYQLKRFLEDQNIHKLHSIEEIMNWTEHLIQLLSQVSLDFLFIFEDLEEWEGEESYHGLFEIFTTLSLARNAQLLLSINPSFSPEPPLEGLENYKLIALTERDIWPNGATPQQKEAYDYANGHTGLLIHLLYYLKPEDELRIASSRLMQELHPRFKLFKNRFTSLQWKLLRAIALEEEVAQPHAFDFLVKYKLGAASSVERALRNLIDSGMISRYDSGWQLTQVVHKRWLQWLYSSSSH